MPTLLYHDAITKILTMTMCLLRSQENNYSMPSYTRLVTYNIVAHTTLTIRFVLKKTYVACLSYKCDAHLNHKHIRLSLILH